MVFMILLVSDLTQDSALFQSGCQGSALLKAEAGFWNVGGMASVSAGGQPGALA